MTGHTKLDDLCASSAKTDHLARPESAIFHRLVIGRGHFACSRPGSCARVAGRGVAWYLLAVAADPDKVIAPAPGDEARMWSLLEAAWARLGPDVGQARQALVVRPSGSPADTAVLKGALPNFLDALRGLCQGCRLANSPL